MLQHCAPRRCPKRTAKRCKSTLFLWLLSAAMPTRNRDKIDWLRQFVAGCAVKSQCSVRSSRAPVNLCLETSGRDFCNEM